MAGGYLQYDDAWDKPPWPESLGQAFLGATRGAGQDTIRVEEN